MSSTILVVEDYPDLRTAVVSVLVHEHYVCDVATSAEAVAMLSKRDYAMVLLDPILPIADDPVVRYLNAHQPSTPTRLILMTEPDEPTGGYRTLLKPFDARELIAQMRG